VVSRPTGRALTIRLAAESARVGLALGYRVPAFGGERAECWAEADRSETWQALDTMLTPTSAEGLNWRASMAQDVAKGRPTEIEEMNGFVVTRGREAGVATPVSRAVVEMVRAVERGQRAAGPENIDEVLRRAGD
jgi:2-dehydropantoate 2-reductase